MVVCKPKFTNERCEFVESRGVLRRTRMFKMWFHCFFENMEKTDLVKQVSVRPIGYGRFQLILSDEGQPIDAILLEVNTGFETHFNLQKERILGKSKFDLFSEFYKENKQVWLNKFCKVAFHQDHFVEVIHFESDDSYYELSVSSPKEGEFITLFKKRPDPSFDQVHQQILTDVTNAVFLTDATGKLLFVNPEATQLLAEPEGELLNYECIDDIIGEDYKKRLKKIPKNDKVVRNLEQTIIDAEGGKHHLLIDIKKVNIGHGKLLFTCHHVSSKKAAFKGAEDQRGQFKEIINTIPDLVWMKDTEGKYLTCNREFELFYGFIEKEIIGKRDHDFVPKELADLLRKHDLKAMNLNHPSQNEETITYRIGGKTVEVETTKTPFYNSAGNLVGVLGISRDITERNAIQKELFTSKLRLEQLVNTADGVLWEADPETFEFSYVSGKVEEILGYSPEEWMSSPTFWIDHVYQEDREKAAGFCLDEISDDRSYQRELRFHKKDESVIWVKEYITAVKDEKGNVVNLVGLTIDIDEQQQNKFDLKKYHRFFNISQDNFCIGDSNGVIVELNPQFPKTLGFTYEELKGRKFSDFIHPDDIEATREAGMNLINDGASIHFRNRYRTKNGEYRHFDWNATLHNGLLYSVARDITNEVEADLKKQESDLKYRNLIDTAGDAIYILDKDGVVLDVNEACCELTGYTREELIDSFVGLINKSYPDQEYFRKLAGVIRKHKSFLHESVHTTRNGLEVPVELNIRIAKQGGEPLYFVIARDISERKAQENRFSKMVENAQYGIALLDKTGTIKVANQELSRILGYEKVELYKMKFNEFAHPDDSDEDIRQFKKLYEGNIDHYSLNRRHIDREGVAKYVKVKMTMIEDPTSPDGSLALAMVEDLSEIMRSEARYESLVETALYAIYTVDQDGRVLEVNNAATEMLGYSKDEFKETFYWNFDVSFTKREFKKFAELLGDGVQFESMHTSKDNKEIPVEISTKSFESGGEKWMVAIVSDITERKNAELDLKRANEELTKAQKIANLGSWRLDVTKNELRWSDEIFRIFGEEPQSFEGTLDAFYAFVHPDERDYVKSHFEECVEEHKDYRIKHRIITKHGEIKYVEEHASFEFNEEDSLLIANGTVQDITESELNQQELKLREKNLQKFFENVHVGIVKNAIDGKFLEINPEFERFTGYNLEELKKISYWDLTPKKYRPIEEKYLRAVKKEGRYGPYQKEYLTKEGNLVSVLMNGVRIADSTGEEFIWSVAQDISEREKNKQKLQQDVEKFKLLLEIGKLIAFEVELETGKVSTIRNTESIDDTTFPLTKVKNMDGFLSVVKAEHRVKCERKLDSLLNKELDQFSSDIQIRHGDSYFWHKVIIAVLEVDEEGKPYKVFITLRNIEKEKNEEIRRLISQEKERLRISRDIHDSIGQMLVGTRLTLNTKKGQSDEIMSDIDELLGDMIKESRLIINNFGISIQDFKNLKDAFINLGEKMNKAYSGHINVTWEGETEIDDLRVATDIFRIYQEALSNAIKYSRSIRIDININNKDYFKMEVIDYGLGFDPDSTETGFGTKNMRERALEIDGMVTITSEEGKGTKVSLRLNE